MNLGELQVRAVSIYSSVERGNMEEAVEYLRETRADAMREAAEQCKVEDVQTPSDCERVILARADQIEKGNK